MSEATKADKKNVIILASVIGAAIVIGVFIYAQQKQTKSFSVRVGGKEISASITE